MKNSIPRATYNAQISSVSPQYGDIKAGTVLEFDRISERSFTDASGKDVVSTSILYNNVTSRKKVRFSISMLEGLIVKGGKLTHEEEGEDGTETLVPTSITVDADGVNDTGIYSIRDHEGFQKAFDKVEKNWNDLTAEMREDIRATDAKANAQSIKEYTVTVSHDVA